MEIILLGTGSSTGTPVLGCDCPTCTSSDPRNKRTRSSAAVRMRGGGALLIDTGPDLRLQALRERLLRVDGVLYTHTHADHLNGIDDLRNYCYLQKQAIPVFGNEMTINNIRQRFGYAFGPAGQYWDKPVLTSHVVAESFDFAGARVTPVPLLHGTLPIFGYRINNIAYLTDFSLIDEQSMGLLRGVDVLFLDCLHYRPHRTHVHLDKALEYAQRIDARETYLIHMTHQMEYGEASARLPAGVRLGCDGLRLYIDD